MNGIDLCDVVVLTDWRGEFISALEAQGCSRGTLRSYLQDVASFERWFEATNGQPFSPELITGVDLRAFREFQVRSVAPATWNRRRSTLRKLCEWAISSGALPYDPFQGVERMEQSEPAPRWLSDAEYHRLVRQMELAVNGATTDHWRWQAVRDQAIVTLMLHAGLREAEVCALDWDDVTISERKGRVIVRRGKGDKRREIPLNVEARRAIRLWREISDGAGAMFVGKGGGRISTRLVQNRVKVLRTAAGLGDEATPHALRHTFAKRLLDGGAPLTVVSKLLGHSRLETTARYVQPGWDDFEQGVEKL